MKKWLVIAVVLAVLVASGLFVGLQQLRPMLGRELSTALQSPVTVGAVTWAPPVGLRVQALTAQNPPGFPPRAWLRVSSATVHMAPWAWVWRRTLLVDATLIRPEVVIEQLADGRLNLPAPPTAPAPAAAGHGPAPPPATGPSALQIRDGAISYVDHRTMPTETAIRLDEVRLDVHPTWPSLAVAYQGSGTIRAPTPGAELSAGTALGPAGEAVGDVRLEGQTTADGVTTATISLTHRALAQLSPYLRQLLGTDVTAGAAAVQVRLQGHREQVSAQVHLELEHLAFPPEAMTSLGISAQQLVALLSDEHGRLQLDVAVTGRWDQLQVSWDQLISSALQQALRSMLARRAQQAIVEGVTKALQDGKPEAIGDQLKALGKEFKRAWKKSVESGEPAQESPKS